MSVNPSSMILLAPRTTSVNRVAGSNPKVSRTIPTTNETTISRTATIAGDPPTNRATVLVMTEDFGQPIAPTSSISLRELHDRRRLGFRRIVGLAADLLAVDRQAPVRGAKLDRRAVADLAGKQHLGQRVLHPFLDHSLQRTRAVGRIIALLGQPLPRLGVEA